MTRRKEKRNDEENGKGWRVANEEVSRKHRQQTRARRKSMRNGENGWLTGDRTC